jgi:hypothetical protein
LGCDNTLPESYLQEWDSYQKCTSRVNEVKILRVLCPTGSERFKLPGFSDASERAYSAVNYLRRFGCDKTITVQIMCQNKSGIAKVTVKYTFPIYKLKFHTEKYYSLTLQVRLGFKKNLSYRNDQFLPPNFQTNLSLLKSKTCLTAPWDPKGDWQVYDEFMFSYVYSYVLIL